MFTISKDFAFEASHQLVGLPDGHPCGRLHGHSYTVRVALCAEELDIYGFVLDYGELAPLKRWIDEHLDHQHLNDVMTSSPTSENLARWLADVVVKFLEGGDVRAGVMVATVGVSETSKTWTWWTP